MTSSILAALFFVLLVVPATAQTPPCISIDPGWTAYYPLGQISMAGYNLKTKALVISFRQSPPTNRIFQNVPQSVFQRMQALSSADAFFAANIVKVYGEALLTSLRSNLCPILAQTGLWILTHPNPPTPPPTGNYLLSDSGIHLLSDSGIRLTKG